MKGQAKIEERARQYCALVATAVAGVAAAGVSAYSSYSQGKAQEKAAGAAMDAASADPAGAYGSKVKMPQYKDNVGDDIISPSYGTQVWEDFNDSLPLIFEISNSMNARNINMRNKVAGGKNWSNAIRQQGENINSMLDGEIPTDVQDQINRYVAESVGGGFDPSAPGGYGGGISQMGSSLARSLGLTSMDIMDKGMSYAPQWEQMVDQFTYKPQDVMRDVQPFMTAAQIQLQRDQNMYEGQVNSAIAEGAPNPQVAGMINDRLRMDTATAQSKANQMQAISGMISAGAGGATSIYNSFQQPSMAGAAVPNVVKTPTGANYAYKAQNGFYKV